MTPAPTHEFSGLKGRAFAWFLTSPLRRVLEWKMGRPEERLLTLMDLEGDEQILDAGSGSGFHTLMLARALDAGRVVAVDISPEMLQRLRALADAEGLSHRLEVIEGDILGLPHADGTFDRAISAAVWHHLDDPQGAAGELARVLRPGGRVVVSDLAIDGGTKAVAGLDGHDTAFGLSDMERILHDAGFVDIAIEQVGRWIIGTGVMPAAQEVS